MGGGGAPFTLTYDYDDQLVSTSGAIFGCDAAGRRVERTAGGITTGFLFDGGSVLLEKQGATTTATYTYGNALIRKDGETPLFDGLASQMDCGPRALLLLCPQLGVRADGRKHGEQHERLPVWGDERLPE